MATFFAICDNPNCKAIFPAPNLIDGSFRSHMTSITYGPCPYCGSDGHIPDGIYEFEKDILKNVFAFPESVEQLNEIRDFFRSKYSTNITKDELVSEVSKVTSNDSLGLKIAGSSMSVSDLLQTICAILTLAILIHTTYLKKEEVKNDDFRKYLIEENKWYRENIQKQTHYNPKQSTSSPKAHMQRKPLKYNVTPLNSPCPCGSGKQYKRCHGKL